MTEHKGLAATAKTGDLRATLEAMRDKLASDMEAAEPQMVAQISGQLRQVLSDIASLPAERPDGVLKGAGDELAKLRQSKTGPTTAAGAASRKSRRARPSTG